MLGIFDNKSLTKEQKTKYIRSEYEITKKNLLDNKNDKYVRNDITEKIIKNCRGVKKSNGGVSCLDKEKNRENSRSLLGFKGNEIYERKKYSLVKRIKRIFPNEIINDQYKVKNYVTDLEFPVHKLGIEIDENGHSSRSSIKEQKREKIIKKETGFKIIRTNPDKENFYIDDKIGEIQVFISNSNKKLTEESIKNKIIDDSEKLTKMAKQLCV